jgi:hypothetical protein
MKIVINKASGFIETGDLSFDNFNESKTLQTIVHPYDKVNGVYPECARAKRMDHIRDNKGYELEA